MGGLLSIGSAAFEGGTRVGKGLIGMGDVTDENESLGVQSYSSLHLDDYDYESPPPRRRGYRPPLYQRPRYRRGHHGYGNIRSYETAYDPWGMPYEEPQAQPVRTSGSGSVPYVPGSPFRSASRKPFNGFSSHRDVPGAAVTGRYKNLPWKNRDPGYSFERRRSRYRSYDDY